MAMGIELNRVEFSTVRVTSHTDWTFAEVFDTEGAVSVVEITRGEHTHEAATLLAQHVSTLKGKAIADESHVVELLGLSLSQLQSNRALATAVSALRTAILDLQAAYNGLSMTEALGGTARESVALYANINRSLLTQERTPATFAAAAERAIRDGFAILKCAPFDEVQPPATTGEVLYLARPGLDRVAAMRAAVGPDIRVLVDCHSRFEVYSAPLIAEELAKLDVAWFEEPLQPTKNSEGLAVVASSIDIPIAGGESGYGREFFGGLVRTGAVSIVMPDIKYSGGVAEAYCAGRAATAAGGQVSLHSPSGPISQLASAHVTAAISGALALEHAVKEAPWRADLVLPRERIEGGRLWFPGGLSLGATLNPDVVSRYGRRWRV